MTNIAELVWKVAQDMRGCGDLHQRNEDERDRARRTWHDRGVHSYTIDRPGTSRVYAFTIPASVLVKYELEFGEVTGISQSIKVPVDGFTLDPSKDWNVVGYFMGGRPR